MKEFSLEQPRRSHGRWTTSTGKSKVMSILKKKRKLSTEAGDGNYYVEIVKPQDHGIKKALLERTLLADTSVILQKLIVEILHTSTEKNVKELILAAMKKMKWETELFAKQLDKRIAEAEMPDPIPPVITTDIEN